MSDSLRSPKLRHLHCRPTRLGIGTLVLVVLLWLVGLQYQANLAYLSAFWLIGLIAVAVLSNLRQLLALRIDVDITDEVFAGDHAILKLTPINHHRNRWLWLCREDQLYDATAENWKPWHIEAGQPQPFIWQIPATQRGSLDVPALCTASVAPFGLMFSYCVWQWPTRIVVYPMPIPHRPDTLAPHNSEQHTHISRTNGEDISHLDYHQNGQSLHHIAWKAYAKTGRLLDKRFETPQTYRPDHIISYRDYPLVNDVERMAGLLCYRVLEAERQNLPYTLELPTATITPCNGQRPKALTALAFLQRTR